MPDDNLSFGFELIAMEIVLLFAIREGDRTIGTVVVSKIIE